MDELSGINGILSGLITSTGSGSLLYFIIKSAINKGQDAKRKEAKEDIEKQIDELKATIKDKTEEIKSIRKELDEKIKENRTEVRDKIERNFNIVREVSALRSEIGTLFKKND